jgi:hypothetical protein
MGLLSGVVGYSGRGDALVSVYIDPQMGCLVSRAWRWPTSCHMFSDSLDELHAFAARIGLRRAWFQDGRFPTTTSTSRGAAWRSRPAWSS